MNGQAPKHRVDKYIREIKFTSGDGWTVCELIIDSGFKIVTLASDETRNVYYGAEHHISPSYASATNEYIALIAAKEQLASHLLLVQAYLETEALIEKEVQNDHEAKTDIPQ